LWALGTKLASPTLGSSRIIRWLLDFSENLNAQFLKFMLSKRIKPDEGRAYN
jgi:hypothetical protein